MTAATIDLPPVSTSEENLPIFDPLPLLTQELKLPSRQIEAVLKLLADGSTVPFIARYRKEMTGGLDEVQIRTIEERQEYLRELDKRRQNILKNIQEQAKLTPELHQQILACTTKATLEDLYLPYKRKKKTRASVAREKGLEPLAQLILSQPLEGVPLEAATAYISAEPEKEVADAEAALAGARDIIAEIMAEQAPIRAKLRELLGKEGVVVSTAVPEKTQSHTKYEQYYQFREKLSSIPSHRFLAIRRGQREGILKLTLELDTSAILQDIDQQMGVNLQSPFAVVLREALQDGFQRLLYPAVENELLGGLKERSDLTAVQVFANNLRNLLLASPLGGHPVLGIDPGIRTGCKCVALDATGKFLDKLTIFPEQEAQKEKAKEEFLAFVKQHQPEAIAIGNGTAGRETESFVRKTLAEAEITNIMIVPVNESGASVYSASPQAREEFPDLDLTFRGSISIARRLQDPLAELVKIEPKSIGVGQYQHDVQKNLLERKLSDVVESCVNHVGVELNTASAALLSYVSGIGPKLAKEIVQFRETHGLFDQRQKLNEVSGFGPKTFQQAAGFLRIRTAQHPLDASAVHPERYELVEKMAQDLGVELSQLIGNTEMVEKIDIRQYISEEVGEPTLRDILDELKKPGRDPRHQFEPPQFREDVRTVEELKPGMILDGIVTNVAAFGVFVDIGVHHDGLLHISRLSDRYIKDPHQVISVGERVKVRILEVDTARKRIQLTTRLEDGPPRQQRPRRGDSEKARNNKKNQAPRPQTAQAQAATGQKSAAPKPQRNTYTAQPKEKVVKTEAPIVGDGKPTAQQLEALMKKFAH